MSNFQYIYLPPCWTWLTPCRGQTWRHLCNYSLPKCLWLESAVLASTTTLGLIWVSFMGVLPYGLRGGGGIWMWIPYDNRDKMLRLLSLSRSSQLSIQLWHHRASKFQPLIMLDRWRLFTDHNAAFKTTTGETNRFGYIVSKNLAMLASVFRWLGWTGAEILWSPMLPVRLIYV